MSLDRQEMVRVLSEQYPAIRADLTEESWVGLTTLEIACFTRYTQHQIDTGDQAELRRCFETARQFLLYGDSDVSNAICVSFLEHLNFQDGRSRRSWAKSLLPVALAEALSE